MITLFAFLILIAKEESAKDDFLFSEKEQPYETSGSVVYLEKLPETKKLYSTFHLKGSFIHFKNIQLSNDHYDFQYPKKTQGQGVALAWEVTPLQFLGRWGVKIDASYATYHSHMILTHLSGTPLTSKIRIHIFPLTAHLIYLFDFTSWMKWLLPTVEVGGGPLFFIQQGSLDGITTLGNSWIAQGGGGLRHSLEWLGFSEVQILGEWKTIFYSSSSKPNFTGQMINMGLLIGM